MAARAFGLAAGIFTQAATESFYDAAGRLVGMKDARGRLSRNRLDGEGNIVEKLGPHPLAVETFQYDAVGELQCSGSPRSAGSWSVDMSTAAALPAIDTSTGRYFFDLAFFDSSAARRRYDLPSMVMTSA